MMSYLWILLLSGLLASSAKAQDVDTSDEAVGDPETPVDDAEPEVTGEDTPADPVAADAEPDPAADAEPDPAADDVEADPAADDVEADPAADDVEADPAADDVEADPTDDDAADPTDDDAADPAVDDTEADPAADDVEADPVADAEADPVVADPQPDPDSDTEPTPAVDDPQPDPDSDTEPTPAVDDPQPDPDSDTEPTPAVDAVDADPTPAGDTQPAETTIKDPAADEEINPSHNNPVQNAPDDQPTLETDLEEVPADFTTVNINDQLEKIIVRQGSRSMVPKDEPLGDALSDLDPDSEISQQEGQTAGSQGKDQPQARGASSTTLAGILCAIGVAAVGAVTGYFTYQRKQLCFKNGQEADPEAARKADAAEAQSDPQVLNTLLKSDQQ